MALRVGWSRRAVSDLEHIAEYIAADSPRYARSVVTKILNEAKLLARFPRSGRRVPEFDDDDMRELIVYSYRVIYQVQTDKVLIAAIIHGKRML
jgi:toxin ParE1/3/4